MAVYEKLIAELTQEAAATRRVLQRTPADKLTWRPHAKSMSLGQLANHVAFVPRGVAWFLEELEVQAPDFQHPEPDPEIDLVATLDESVAYAIERLGAWQDEGLAATWTMKQGDTVVLQMPRIQMVRSVMLNHWYHHRGQLTVYLRLLDVPVPSVYGPSADESPFAA